MGTIRLPPPPRPKTEYTYSFHNRSLAAEEKSLSHDKVKHRCWNDAKILRKRDCPEAVMEWADTIKRYAHMNETVRSCLMSITASYLDYACGYAPKEYAERLVSEQLVLLDRALSLEVEQQTLFQMARKQSTPFQVRD